MDYNQNLLYKGLINKDNFGGQEITLISPIIKDNCKCHLKTIFLYNKIDKEYNKNAEKNYELKNITIYDLNEIVYSSASSYFLKNSYSFRETLKYNNIFLLEDEYSPNILFSYLTVNKSIEILSHLNEYSIFRGGIYNKYLSRKDYAYELYFNLKQKFPKDFDYMPESYIISKQKSEIEIKFKNYTQKENDLWLCKPVSGSLGEGIYFLKNYQDFLNCTELITKYIHNPHLSQKRKYHIRLYDFISSFIPLKIYVYKEAQIKRASHEYKYNLNEVSDRESFITNSFANIRKEGYLDDISLNDLKEVIIKEGGNWTYIWEQIKDICIKLIISIYDIEYDHLSLITNNEAKSFAFFGLDLMIDDNYKVWLLEANDAPHMNSIDKVNDKNKIGFSTDVFNLLGIVPFDHSNGNPLENKACHFNNRLEKLINNAFCEFSRPQGNLERIFPVKETLSYYRQFFIKEYKENIELWKHL